MSTRKGLLVAPDHYSFPKEEDKILEYWSKIDAFRTSHAKSIGRPEYSFYDGPPFATGLPHYGHILAGTIKDIVTRYAYQTGHCVERRFGWDCHGLPVEYEIDQQLGIKSREDVLKMGIDKYNAKCREIVMRYSKEWKFVVERCGRWIDFEHDYKTLDTSFMESEWWGFKQLFEKGLVYRGFKVMPYSTACATPLSNFEANQNYQDVQDPAIIVRFPLVDDPELNLIAWTTTPWTLPSNLALCVHPEFEYVVILDKATKQKYIMLEARISAYYKSTDDYEIVQRGLLGKDLVGKKYVPLFEYFRGRDKGNYWKVIADTYVTNDSGTGIVHCAPGFGEDDFRVCMANGVIEKGENIPCPLDANGRFTPDITDYAGVYVKETDKPIMKRLKECGRLIHQGTITHSYPFCWRSETPLIYRTVPSWFVAVEKIKENLINNNTKTYWVPAFVQEKRFHNWLVDARDWAVSRSRFWGTPIPLWVSDDFEEIVCVGSVKELEELTGATGVTDLHRENIDGLTIPSRLGKGVLHRVDDVFDCWFESGSMPWAQVHYPFENVEKFERTFPADFIAEGLDQTRGWFYTLMVMSTALFNKPSFKNLVVNGLVLAEDGRKMSKRLRNYPDPLEVVNAHGADALRLYLINSPVVRAERLKFKLAGVKDVVKELFLPWYNAYRFLTQTMLQWETETNGTFEFSLEKAMSTTNVTDRWIMASLQTLVAFVREEMKAYRLYTVIPRLVSFIEDLTNWYVRLNRKRLKGDEADVDVALQVLFYIMLNVCLLMAPYTPFLTEHMYQNLKKALPTDQQEDSVHYNLIPEPLAGLTDPAVERRVEAMKAVVVLGRSARDKAKIPLKQPLKTMRVVHNSPQFIEDVKSLETYILGELSLKTLELTTDESQVKLSVVLKMDVLGPVLGKKIRPVSDAVSKWTSAEIIAFRNAGSAELDINGEKIVLNADDVKMTREYTAAADDKNAYVSASEGDVLVLLDTFQDENLLIEGMVRDFTTRVQKLRKKGGLTPQDKIVVYYRVTAAADAVSPKTAKKGTKASNTLSFADVIERQKDTIKDVLKSELEAVKEKPEGTLVDNADDAEVEGETLDIWIKRV